MIVLSGATPVFADVDRETLMVTPEILEPLITERTKLIVPVHYAGSSLDLDGIRELATARGVHVIEDAAHATGTHYRGKPVGSSGTAIFSFHPIKNITSGEGGLVVTDDAELAERLRRLRFHGLGLEPYDPKQPGRSPHSQVVEPGFKYNLPDMNAVMGLGQIDRLEGFIQRRGQLAELYLDRLRDIEEIRPLGQVSWPVRHSWHLLVVRLDIDRAGLTRDELMSALRERDIGSGLHFRPAHLHRYYLENGITRRGMLPNTEWNGERILSLPMFPQMTEADVERVVDAIRDILGSRP